MWNRFRNATSSSKIKGTKEKENRCTLKKSVSMDSLHQKQPSTYIRKRNGSLDANLFSNSYWFTHDMSTASEHSSRSKEETFVIALIGKPSVGKSTIVRTGLSNLAPIKNVGVEVNVLHAPTLITEIDVDDQSYPVEILEIQENVFNMKSGLKWPRELREIDGVLVCYDVTNRSSIANIAWLLNAFREFQVPSILVACKTDSELAKCQVDTQYGVKLGDLFNVGFVELDTRTDQGVQKIHDVFSMLLRLSIRQREFSKKEKNKKSVNNSAHVQSTGSDVDLGKRILNHRRSSSDQSNESRGKNRLVNLPAVKYVSSYYASRFGSLKRESRKSQSLLDRQNNEDESSLPILITSSSSSSNASEIAVAPSPQTSQKNSMTSSQAPKPHRRSLLPSSTLLQVIEAEEEKDIGSGHNRVSCCSYDSTISSVSVKSGISSTWDNLLVNELISERELNKCAGCVWSTMCLLLLDTLLIKLIKLDSNKDEGLTIDELIQRLTIGGQYDTSEDSFMISFYVIYRTFMRPRDVLVKLMQRFRDCGELDDKRNTTHEKICNLLYHWITQHPHDLIHPQTRKMMRQFLDIISNCSHLTYYAIILAPLINGTIPSEDPDVSWGLSDLYDEELDELDSPEEQIIVDKISALHNPKKDSGFGSWIVVGDKEGIILDNIAPPPRVSRPSLQNHRKASLIIISNGLEGRPMSQMTFEELPEKVIASELTYQEFQLFKKISGRDLLRHIWTPQNNIIREKGKVAKSIQHFNFISNWVVAMILSQEKLKNRANMMKKFMKVAIIVRESNNYNTLMAIIAAINSAPILRLRQTRDSLKGRSTCKKFNNLENLMSSDKSFGNYRLALKSSMSRDEQKAIPYLGVHLQDLLSIGEGNRNFQKDGKIHWNKFSLMCDVINMIYKYQRSPYILKSNKFIEKFINDTLILNDDESYNKSLELEPRVQRAASTSRVRRR
ncbi:7342_t:CDS:10 [Acaulospora morrowiae]|uniref:7342_t:CDS:1 n=1 Tax=Acaulospora morrowiae TaxID=94023 RepID=A0A9N9BNU7_9GLOM|nr:7342_t:CDS:10 [Acaulospora morrowiae]